MWERGSTLICALIYRLLKLILFCVQVAMDLVAVIGFSTILEPLWGIKEFMVGCVIFLNT